MKHRPRDEYRRTTARRPLTERFWEKVEKTQECWLWLGGHNGNYGKFWDGQRVVSAHRLSYELLHGPLPPGVSVLHLCDTPLCVRPDHLWAGTQADNMQDAAKKGRVRGPWSHEGYVSPFKGVPSGRKGQPWSPARRAAWLSAKENQ